MTMKTFGFTKRRETFSTSIINLCLSKEVLRKNLKQKWRNALNKSEKSELEVKVDQTGASLDAFLEGYELDKKKKNTELEIAVFF